MKKAFTILMISIISTTLAFAQLQFGPTAGLNMASITGDDAYADDLKIGMHVGVSTNMELSDVLTLKSGLLYSM